MSLLSAITYIFKNSFSTDLMIWLLVLHNMQILSLIKVQSMCTLTIKM